MKSFINKNLKIGKKHIYAICVLLVIVSSVAGYFLGLSVQKNNYAGFLKSFRNIREDSDKYSFINPLIGAISAPATDVGLYSDIKDEISSYLKKEEKDENLYDYSFYFRDLGTGMWFGVNESSDFFPASLFKLPIAIAVYKEAEDNPNFLKQTAVYTTEIANLNDSIVTNSESGLVVGKSYFVDDLVEIMLTKSDNGAKNLLLTAVDKTYLDQLFKVVTLGDPSSVKTYQVSSRKYAHFLRVLYGSSYLNEEHSEFILKLLSKTTFNDGMVAGIPVGVSVSHKFGTYEIEEEINGIKKPAHYLHDCGVIYHKEKPYVFCFMTEGKDLKSLFRIISHVSNLVYENQEENEQ